jgi:MOSC domain-containing protein YiiM
MRVLSVNVGLPREVTWRGKPITTGIYKQPVAGRVAVRALNLDGDRQAALRVHGGRDKAVYAYPSEFCSPSARACSARTSRPRARRVRKSRSRCK